MAGICSKRPTPVFNLQCLGDNIRFYFVNRKNKHRAAVATIEILGYDCEMWALEGFFNQSDEGFDRRRIMTLKHQGTYMSRVLHNRLLVFFILQYFFDV